MTYTGCRRRFAPSARPDLPSVHHPLAHQHFARADALRRATTPSALSSHCVPAQPQPSALVAAPACVPAASTSPPPTSSIRCPSQPRPPHQGPSILAVPRPRPSCVSYNVPLVSSPNRTRPIVSRRRACSLGPSTQSFKTMPFGPLETGPTSTARRSTKVQPCCFSGPASHARSWEELDVTGVLMRPARPSDDAGGGKGVHSVLIGALYAPFYSTKY